MHSIAYLVLKSWQDFTERVKCHSLQVMKVLRHPWTGSLYLVFPTKLYESIDGGNQFIEKHMERLPESFDIKRILFKEDEGLYAVHVLDIMKKRSIP